MSAPSVQRRTPLGYWAACDWLILNDDIAWAEDDDPCIGVTGALVADIYHKSNQQVVADLLRRKNARRSRSSES